MPSPALWNDPLPRLGDLLAVRTELLTIQVGGVPTGPMSLEMRLAFLFLQPFAAPLMQYEVQAWAGVTSINAEAAAYLASPLSGWHWGMIGGLVATGIAFVGVVGLLIALWRSPLEGRSAAVGLLIWLLGTMIAMLTNPLPWQRYYLPLIPISAVLVGVGLLISARPLLKRR